MIIRNDKIVHAADLLTFARLNAAEKLRIAERLLDDVVTSLGPMVQPTMCIAEGMLTVAQRGIEGAREYVQDWQGDDLPTDPGLETAVA